MDSNLINLSSSPEVVDSVRIPFPKTLQFHDLNGTDDEASPDTRDTDPPSSKSRRHRASFAPAHHLILLAELPELPPALWAPGNNTTSGLRIPPSLPPQAFLTPTRRKRRDRSPVTAEEPSSEPEVFVQRPKGKPLAKRRAVSSTTTILDASPERHSFGRVGRPSKVQVEDPQNRDFSAHVFIEIANPPKLHRGKTHKTNKYVPQGPTTEGPFTFTHSMSWKSFMSQVAELAELEEKDVALTQMNWHFQGKTKSLPLGSFGGFTAMVTQIRALKIGALAIILLGIPVPIRPNRGGRNAPADGEDMDDVAGSDIGDGGMWSKKVCDFTDSSVVTVFLWPILMYILKDQS